MQVCQRVASGRFVQVYAGEGPAESAMLGAWVHGPRGQVPRITEDEAGEHPWLTEAEADRAAREAAELELARLREEIARLRA